MGIPGYTAAKSLYRSSICYRSSLAAVGTTALNVAPAAYDSSFYMEAFRDLLMWDLDTIFGWADGSINGGGSTGCVKICGVACPNGSASTNCRCDQECRWSCINGNPYVWCEDRG
jgi:hypothetical protein